MEKLFYFICCLTFLLASSTYATSSQHSQPTQQPLNKKYLPHTQLSKKALRLKVGMTREEVYKLLGKPTWGQSYEGQPLDWTWRNGKCNPVDVTFDENLRVNGFDEGRLECDKTIYKDVPGRRYLCTNSRIKKLCDPRSKLGFKKLKKTVLKKAISVKV